MPCDSRRPGQFQISLSNKHDHLHREAAASGNQHDPNRRVQLLLPFSMDDKHDVLLLLLYGLVRTDHLPHVLPTLLVLLPAHVRLRGRADAVLSFGENFPYSMLISCDDNVCHADALHLVAAFEIAGGERG